MSIQEKRTPYIRGVIVNKAIDNKEEKFRSLLDAQFGIELGLSWPIPLDPGAIKVYKDQLIPYKVAPDLPFCSSTLNSFTDSFDLVTIEWPKESKERWRGLVRKVNEEKELKEIARIKANEEAQKQTIEAEHRIKEALLKTEQAESNLNSLREQLQGANERIEKFEKNDRESTEKLHDLEVKTLRKIMRQRMLILFLSVFLIFTTAFYWFSYKSIKVDNQEIFNQLKKCTSQSNKLENQYKDLEKKYIPPTRDSRELK